MAYDGLVIAGIVHELNHKLLGGRIGKISQPEKDELILTIRNQRTNYKLLLSTLASMPKIHLTQSNKKSPLTAQGFLMLLRKHLVGSEILSITQPNYDRIVDIHTEGMDELGVSSRKHLIIEMMGRHSNIILTDDEGNILDAIRRVGALISSVREVFPGRIYTAPPGSEKLPPLPEISEELFFEKMALAPTVSKGFSNTFFGISFETAEALCLASGLHGDDPTADLSKAQFDLLYQSYKQIVTLLSEGSFLPRTYMDSSGTPVTFSVMDLPQHEQLSIHYYDSVSLLVDEYYEASNTASRIKQKSADLRKLVNTNLERCYKKLKLQTIQLRDTDDRDKYRIRGELLQANLYRIEEGAPSITVEDYYNDNAPVTIKLDPMLTPNQNATKLFEKYNKKKRTLVALTEQLATTTSEIEHLESVKYAIESALTEEDLLQIRQELMDTGYVRFRKQKKEKDLGKAKPHHYLSSDGFDLYVGRNNYQNDELSMKFAGNNDWWFHAKEVPGSHVIVKAGKRELTDRCYEEAAALAAYYSSSRQAPKVSVDYTTKKNLKKPTGSAPGYVIYHTNYSMMIAPSISSLTLLDD